MSGKRWLIKGQEYHFDKPMLMGILNVTPDSFSDGGKYSEQDSAVHHALQLIEQGSDIIDVGGESSRPGSAPVDVLTEIARVIPVIKAISKKCDTLISIDTQKSEVARAALVAGASIINDVSGGLNDPDMFPLLAESGAGYIMMHMQGIPKTMQNAPQYDNVLNDILNFFKTRLEIARSHFVIESQIVLDPGIGFGKLLDDNLHILANISTLHDLGLPLLLGASRKSFIGMLDGSDVGDRLGGSLAAVIATHEQNVEIFRVHDVHETRQLLELFTAIQKHSV